MHRPSIDLVFLVLIFLIFVGMSTDCVQRAAEAQAPNSNVERYLGRISSSLERIARQPHCRCECR